MKKEYICCVCEKKFIRQECMVKTIEVCCSKKCASEKLKITNKGSNNSRYKEGKYCEPQFCECGKEKDYRAKQCINCARPPLKEGERAKNRPINKRPPRPEIDLDNFKEILKQYDNYLDFSKAIEISRTTATRIIKENGLDISHFKPARGRFSKIENVLCKGTKRNPIVRDLIIRENLIPYICIECKQIAEWNNKILLLELDHMNGDPTDNRLENLRFLCPNCHSQTENNKGKSSRGKPKTRETKE